MRSNVNNFTAKAIRNKPLSQTLPAFTAQDALVAIMVTVSVSDEAIRTSELVAIERQVNHLPIFANYGFDNVKEVAQTVYRLMGEDDGLDTLFAMVREALPERLFETAYALACDIAAADGKLGQSELRLLEEVRDEFEIDRLHAAAIERGARARHLTL
jgi:tellurite resistance protein